MSAISAATALKTMNSSSPARTRKIFRNLRVLVAVENETAGAEIHDVLVQLGAVVVQQVDIDELPHVLVADSTQHVLYKELTAVAPAVPVVTPAWVQECQKLMGKASFDRFKLGCFAGCKICATGYSLPDREALGQKVRENGGEYSADLQRPPHCTHLVARPSKQPSKKLEFALAWKIEVVSEQWLADCIDLGRCLDPARYQVDARGSLLDNVNDGVTTIRATANGPTPTAADEGPGSRTAFNEHTRLPDANAKHPGTKAPSDLAAKLVSDAPTQPVRPALGTSTMLTDCRWGCSRPNLYLEAVQLHAVGCDEALTYKMCLSVMEAGATRLPTLLPQVTHVLVGPGVTPEECQAVRQHVSAHKHVQLVRPEWLDDCVHAKMYVQPGRHLLTPTTMLAAVQRQQDEKAAHAAPGVDDSLLEAEDALPDCGGRMSGMWFTLVAVQGTSVELKAREVILKAGGKLFDAQSTVLVDRSRAYAVCPMGMSPATLAEMSSKYPDFQMVEPRHRITVYWLYDCLKYAPEQLISLEHYPTKHDVPLSDFRKVVVHATGLDPETKGKIKILVEEVAGGRFLDTVEVKQLSKLTHVIATADNVNPLKLSAFMKHQKPIVIVKWLTESIKSGRKVPEQPYILDLKGVEGLSQVPATTQLPPTQAPRRSTRLSPNPDKKRSRDPAKQRVAEPSKPSQNSSPGSLPGKGGQGTQRTPKRHKTSKSHPIDMGPSQRSNINLKPPKPHTGASQRIPGHHGDGPIRMSQQPGSRAAAAAARLATPLSSPPTFAGTARTPSTLPDGAMPPGVSASAATTTAPPLPLPHTATTSWQPPSMPTTSSPKDPHRSTLNTSGSVRHSHSGPTIPSTATPQHAEVIAQEQHQVDPVLLPDPPSHNPGVLQQVHGDHSNPPSGGKMMPPPSHSNPASLNTMVPGCSNPAGGAHSNPASCSITSSTAAPKDAVPASISGTGERISLFQRVMAAQSPPGLRSSAVQRTSSRGAAEEQQSGEAAKGLQSDPLPASSKHPVTMAAGPANKPPVHVAPGSEQDWEAVEQMFDDLPLHKETLCETQEMFVDLLSGKGNSGQGSLPQPRRQPRGQKSQDSGGSGGSARSRKRPAPAPAGQGRMTRQRQQLLQQQQDLHMPSQFEMSQQIGYDTGPRPAERVTRGRLGNQDKKRKEELLQKLQAVDTKTSRNPDRLQQLGLAE